jgi:hypothetical protein
MEELNNQESFGDFKNRISEIFKTEGLSENLSAEVEKWHSRRYEETDRYGGTIEQRIIFQMELAEIYLITERVDLALETLDDAWTQADQEGLQDLAAKIGDMIRG